MRNLASILDLNHHSLDKKQIGLKYLLISRAAVGMGIPMGITLSTGMGWIWGLNPRGLMGIL